MKTTAERQRPKTARRAAVMRIEMFSLECWQCGTTFVCDADNAYAGSVSLHSSSTVQGSHLRPGDVLRCESCGETNRVPARGTA